MTSPTVRLVQFDIPAVANTLSHPDRCHDAPAAPLAHHDNGQGDCTLKSEKGIAQLPQEMAPALLVSYYYLQPFLDNQVRYRYRDWVMDSGAFSAHNSGKAIDLNAYIDKCLELMEKDKTLTEVFGLDVIGDADATLKNVEEMWRQGVPAIPTFHKGEPEEHLYHMAKEYPKIALGGVAMLRGDDKLAWLSQCFARVWPKKMHGFGMASEAIVYGLPFHSCDATNWEIAPCLSGDSMVSTTEGLKPIKDLVGGYFSVNTYDQIIVNGCSAVEKGVKETIKLKLALGLSITSTPDHKILTESGWLPASSLVVGSKVRIPDKQLRAPVIQECLRDEMFGWMTGDGWFCESNGRAVCGILFTDGDKEAMDKLGPEWDEFIGWKQNFSSTLCRSGKSTIHRKQSQSKAVISKLRQLGFQTSVAISKELPAYIWTAKPEQQLAFLRGLFSADGCLSCKKKHHGGYVAVSLASSSSKMLSQVQILLLEFGIQSTTQWHKPWHKKNGEGQLHITGDSSRRYMDVIGFNISRKQNGFWKGSKWTRDMRKYSRVTSIEAATEVPTYDVVMPAVHHFVANGIVVHNCAFGNWVKFGSMSVRGSNQDLRSQVKHYLDLEAKARVRWEKEMVQLETLEPSPAKLGAPSVRLVANANAGREDAKALALGGSPTVRLAAAAAAGGGLHLANAIGDSKKNPTITAVKEPKASKVKKEVKAPVQELDSKWVDYWKNKKF